LVADLFMCGFQVPFMHLYVYIYVYVCVCVCIYVCG